MVRHKNKNAERPPKASSSRVAKKAIGFPHSGKERKREQAILALLACSTIAEAAARAGVGARTLRTWRTQPEFMAEYRRAKRELVETATGKLRNAMTNAVDVLECVANDCDAPTAARVTAASRILELGFHAHEIEDLAARLEKLEKEQSNDYQP